MGYFCSISALSCSIEFMVVVDGDGSKRLLCLNLITFKFVLLLGFLLLLDFDNTSWG